MARYLLAAHTYVREAAGHAIFLDLKRDRYLAVEPDDVEVLRTVVPGWENALAGDDPDDRSEFDSSKTIVETLLHEGLLTQDEIEGKCASPVSIEQVRAALEDIRGRIPTIGIRDVWNFVRAWAVTTLMLRVLPLRCLVRRVQRRKERYRPESRTFDLGQGRRLMLIYFLLRPNFFSADNACLRDSLTFVEFLALYKIYPTWVFGVTMGPFAAHSWVQEGPMVLNDCVRHVTRFAPILAI